MKDLYGIIGNPLTHSFSQKYFTEKFKNEGIDNAVFENFELKQISEVEALIQNPQLKGFCITIPYKKAILTYLDECTDAVKAMGACNCVKIHNGRLFGFNTDVVGFEKSFTPDLKAEHKKALILGTGGASAAVAYVLEKLGIDFKYVSRKNGANIKNHPVISYQDLNEFTLLNYPIIINCTPLGTFPKITELPELPYSFLNSRHYLYDLVYNPPLTAFLEKGKKAGATIKNGYDMLTLQAIENWRIWTNDAENKI